MAELDSLIRVRKHNVEEKQKILAALYKREEAFKEARDKMETQLAIEMEKTKTMRADLLSYFGPYSEKVRAEIDNIDQKRQKLGNQIAIAQEAMRAAFTELKKVEIINERRKAEEKKVMAKKESDMLDEVAIDGYRRKQSD